MPRYSVQTGAVIAWGILCVGLSAFGAPAQAATHRRHSARGVYAPRRAATPPDSYLEYKVYSVDQLISQVSSNPTVRARFARHFRIPESRVVSYMRANLVESYIPSTKRYTVYCVHHSGTFYPVKQTFQRGTKVFALRNGEPVMKWVCGNPLSHLLPSVETRVIVKRPPGITKVARSIEETPADTMDVLIPSEVTSPVFQPLVPVPVSAVSSAVAGHGTSLFYLTPLALFGLHGHHHHTPTPTPAVPEPGTLLYLSAGIPLAGLMLRRRRKNIANPA